MEREVILAIYRDPDSGRFIVSVNKGVKVTESETKKVMELMQRWTLLYTGNK